MGEPQEQGQRKSAAQRVKDSEQRKKDQGLVKSWVWVYPADRPRIREYAEMLRLEHSLKQE